MAKFGHRVLRASVSLSVGNFLVTLANLGRDAAIASAFGTELGADTFFLALMLPVFMMTVGAGAFRSMVVPLLENLASASGEEGTKAVLWRLMQVNAAVIVAIAVFFAIAVLYYAPLLVGKLPQGAGTMVVHYTWAIIPMMAISAYANLAQGPLQTKDRYFLPNITRVGLPLGIALGAIFLGKDFGFYGACIGGLIGAGIQLGATLGLLSKEQLLAGGGIPRNTKVGNGAMSQFLMLVMGNSLAYISPVIDQWMASFLGTGSVSTLGYANRLAVGVSSLTIGSMGAALLPHFSKVISQRDMRGVENAYVAFWKVGIWIGCGSTIVVWLLSVPIVGLLYERGSFTQHDTFAVARLLGWFALQYAPLLIGSASVSLLSAARMNKVFIPLSVLIAVVNAAGNLLFMRYLGIAGIALSTALTYVVSATTMTVVLYRKGLIRLPVSVWKNFGAAIILATIIAWSLAHFGGKPGINPTWRNIILSMLGLAVYCGVAYAFVKGIIKKAISRKP